MQDKWSEEEVEKIEKLLCSRDYKNVLLGIEFVQQKNEYLPFIPVLAFLKAQHPYSLEEDLELLVEKVEPETKFNEYWEALKIIHAHWDMDDETYLKAVETYEKYSNIFENYMQYNSEYAEPYRRIANKLGKNLNQRPTAIRFFERCLSLAENYAEGHFDYAFLLDDHPENADKIVHHYKQALHHGLEDRAVRHNMGRALVSLKGDLKTAERVYRENIQKYPNFHYSMIELASIVKYQDPKEAESLFLQVIEIDPESDLAYNNLAFFYWDTLEEYDKAYEAIQKALKIKTNHALYWHTLAEVEWYGYQEADKAIKALEKAKSVDPSYLAADEMIEEIQESLNQ